MGILSTGSVMEANGTCLTHGMSREAMVMVITSLFTLFHSVPSLLSRGLVGTTECRVLWTSGLLVLKCLRRK